VKVAAAALTLLVASCGGGSESYTLYRNSPVDANMRIHVASFDAADGSKYNNENCNVAADLFKKQQGVTVRYWCEQGAFKK
jgi:hypothetical protein